MLLPTRNMRVPAPAGVAESRCADDKLAQALRDMAPLSQTALVLWLELRPALSGCGVRQRRIRETQQ